MQIQSVYQPERNRWTVDLADGDRPVQRHNRCGRNGHQLVVQRDDTRPVGLLDARGVGVHRIHGRLQLVHAQSIADQTTSDDRLTFLDQGPIPTLWICCQDCCICSAVIGSRILSWTLWTDNMYFGIIVLLVIRPGRNCLPPYNERASLKWTAQITSLVQPVAHEPSAISHQLSVFSDG